MAPVGVQAMSVALNMTGDKELDAFFATLPKKVQRKPVSKGTREGARIVLGRAKERVPHREGTLEQTLTVRTAKGLKRGNQGHTVYHVERKSTDDPFYAPFVAFGTKKWPITEPSETGDRRYIQEALFGGKTEVVSKFRQVMVQGINEIAAQARKPVAHAPVWTQVG